MPSQKSPALFQRRMLILHAVQRLSRTGRWVTRQELVTYLKNQGFEVEKHNVMRDLRALQENFVQLECNDNARGETPRRGLSYGYRWAGSDQPPEAGQSIPEALSLVMVERYLAEALPVTLTRAIRGCFGAAHRTLDVQRKNAAARWADKICVIQPSQPLLPPPLDEAVVESVHEALIADEQLRVVYQAFDSDAKELQLHPLGLIQRGPATYLVALTFDYDDVLLYALHRMQSVRRTSEPARTVAGFDIRQYAEAQGHFGSGKPLRLKLRVRDHLARLLTETRVDVNQRLSGEDGSGWQELTARVRDSWQLRWWLLGQGPDLEVIAPRQLRADIAELACEAAGLYQ